MTKIQWTDETWNPVTGCTKDQPLRWKRPRRVFVNSMSDLFHEDVPVDFIADVFAVMRDAKQHTFQVLTKRPERMRSFVNEWIKDETPKEMPPNVWLGVSVEDQKAADERIPHLFMTPAAVRFLSCEPLLGPVSIMRYIGVPDRAKVGKIGADHADFDPLVGVLLEQALDQGRASVHASSQMLNWVIVGGESGPKARPCAVEWIRDLVKVCELHEVPVFVKQLGANSTGWFDDEGPTDHAHQLKDRKGGDPEEWPEDLRVRLYP